MKIIKEFSKFQPYTMVDWKDNHEDAFEVELEHEGYKKVVSIPYDLYRDFLLKKVPSLNSYLSGRNITGSHEIWDDLSSLDFAYEDYFLEYAEDHISLDSFLEPDSEMDVEDMDMSDIDDYNVDPYEDEDNEDDEDDDLLAH